MRLALAFVSQKVATMMLSKTVRILLAISGMLAFAFPACAQVRYPERLIRLVVPAAAGGPLDIVGRQLAQQLSPMLGQPIIIENVAGAGNALGTGQVAKAKPDGYTLLIGASSGVIISPVIMKTPTYDGVHDLTAISLLGLQYMVVSSAPSFPARDTRELVALLKANPGKYSYASIGVGSINHLAGELFKSVTGVDVLHVPYKGAVQAMNDVIGGQLELAVMTSASVISLVRASKLKVVSSLSDERLVEFPQVPTAIESGFPGLSSSTFNGLFAPAATARPIINQLHAATATILGSPAFQKQLETLGNIVPPARTPEETQRFVEDFAARITPIIRKAGIKEE